jgi:hypothetical protein
MRTPTTSLYSSIFVALLLATSTAMSGEKNAHQHQHDHHHDHKHKHSLQQHHGQDHEHDQAHQEGAHVHGLAELNLVLEGEQLLMQLQSPAYNIVGFEHKPATQEEQQRLEHAMAQLRASETLFSLPTAAHCTIKEVTLHSPLLEQNTSDHLTHTDIEAEYNYSCNYPEALTHLDVQLLVIFPLMEKITVQTVTPAGQSRVELSAKETRIQF